METITAPIIAITLVLLSVFVPLAFIPGISGTLFRQFAVTISVSMLLSAINALTLSPALCGVMLKAHHGPEARGDGLCLARHRQGAGRLCARWWPGWSGSRCSASCCSAVVCFGIVAVGSRTPTGFLPQEDQGAFFVELKLPEGASLNRTREVALQVEEAISRLPGIRYVSTVSGFSQLSALAQSNSAFFIVTLKLRSRNARRPRPR